MPVKKTDKYPNLLSVSVTESAANTLTFEEVNIGLSAFDRVGLLIHRLEYWPENNFWDSLNASTDFLHMALTTSNQLSDINADERSAIDTVRIKTVDIGTAATGYHVVLPIVRSFTDMPMSGLLVAPRPLYFGLIADGIASAITVQCRMYFTIVKMADADYFELLESRQFYG